MPREGYIQGKVEQGMREEIERTAEEDERKFTDQVRYLLKLGLKAREAAKQAEAHGIIAAGQQEAAERTEQYKAQGQ